MKKTAIVMLSITIVFVGILLSAIFSLGSSEQPLELATIGLESFSDPIQKESEITQLDTAIFEQFNFASAGATRTFTGKILSSKTGSGIQNTVVIVCDGAEVGTGVSSQDGSFKILAKRDDCTSGVVAYAKVEYEGTSYQSSEVTMPNRPSFGRKSETSLKESSLSSQLNTTNEVPEFSMATMGAAVAISLLGILYLRKQ